MHHDFAPSDEGVHRTVPDSRPRVPEQSNQLLGHKRMPVDLKPARIPRNRSSFFLDAINRALDFGLGLLRKRTSPAQPSPGVQQQQGTVGILENVGRVKPDAFGRKKIVFDRRKCSVLRFQPDMNHLVSIKLAGKQRFTICCAE